MATIKQPHKQHSQLKHDEDKYQSNPAKLVQTREKPSIFIKKGKNIVFAKQDVYQTFKLLIPSRVAAIPDPDIDLPTSIGKKSKSLTNHSPFPLSYSKHSSSFFDMEISKHLL